MGKELETIESIRLSFEQWEQITKELNKLPTPIHDQICYPINKANSPYKELNIFGVTVILDLKL